MNTHSRSARSWLRVGRLLAVVLWLAVAAAAQTCQAAGDMEAATRSSLETTGKRYFDLAVRGDTAALQQNSIPSVASSFTGIESAIKDNHAAFDGGQANVRASFLLTAEGTEPLARAEFLCGVFGKSGQTSDSAVFVLNSLPPGTYGVVILDVKASAGASGSAAAAKDTPDAAALTLVLEQVAADWKLAGFYVRAAQLGGHDGPWFAQRAREFKTKGQNWNAWLYFREAIALTAPVDFMSTLATDKLYDEVQSVQPADMPQPDRPLAVIGQAGQIEPSPNERKQPIVKQAEQFAAAKTPKTFSVVQMFPMPVGKDLDLVVKYQSPDISNTGQTFQDNMAVIRGLVAKYPEFRDAFGGVVVRAVEPSGKDYGSLLEMKDVK